MTESQVLVENIPQSVVEVPPERSIPQSEVNELAGKIRHEAYQKGLAEGRNAMAQQQSANVQGALSEEQVRKIVEEQTVRAQQQYALQSQVQRTVQEFTGKMTAGPERYSDFNDKISALKLEKMPEIVALANSADNTADVMYELANNPHKIASLMTLARQMPHLANIEMQKLSNSIKSNQKAAETVQTKEPLSTIKPSSVPTDKGPMTVADFRGARWAKP